MVKYMKKVKLKARIGEYQSGGSMKGVWATVGTEFHPEGKRPYILMNPDISIAGCLVRQNATNGTTKTNLMVAKFEEDFNASTATHSTADGSQPEPGDFDDDIPF